MLARQNENANLKSTAALLSKSVADLFLNVRGGRKSEGFGVELEMEGVRVGPSILNTQGQEGLSVTVQNSWSTHRDGSLRVYEGYEPCEWVFRAPLGLAESKRSVEDLFTLLRYARSRIICSNRTSCHVHYNVQTRKVYEVLNLFILFTILEDILGAYCGEDRNGNLFCLSSRHASRTIHQIQTSLERGTLSIPRDERYASLNMCSLGKFGTVEYRGMRGLDSAESVNKWLDIISLLGNYAFNSIENPALLIEQVSAQGPVGFVREVLGNYYEEVVGAEMSEDYIAHSVYEGLRLTQGLAYSIGSCWGLIRKNVPDFWEQESKKAAHYRIPVDLDIEF